jgi:hypothetical protein
MAETVENASDRPVIVVDLAGDPLWREIHQAEILAWHELYPSHISAYHAVFFNP